MYAARPLIAELLGPDREPIDDKYFTQVLLPDYIAGHERDCAEWDVVYDARGHLVEPHTNASVPLGTMAVRSYLRPRPREPGALLAVNGRTHVVEPRDRYRTVLFIEKEGFLPLLQAARIRERFDCAIMSTKGMSVVAARHLLDRLGRDAAMVLVAHDFERAALAIAHTLAADGPRYTFEHASHVVDIALRLADAVALDLQDEPAPEGGPSRGSLVGYGATDQEVEFLCTRGRCVELNAMTAPQFVTWIEDRLGRYGAGKVPDDDAMLEAVAREALASGTVREQVKELQRAARSAAAAASLPLDLRDRVLSCLAAHRELAWEDAVERVVRTPASRR